MSRRAPYGGVGKATRYCGKVKIACSFDDKSGRHICRLSVNGRRVGTQMVGLPASWASQPAYRKGVDSAEAFDEAARGAIHFALDDEQVYDSDLDYTDTGYRIRRRK